MKIYTKTGDKGQTSLYTGERVLKTDMRINCLGEIDELCSYIGLVKAEAGEAETVNLLSSVQKTLFDIMAGVATKNDLKYALGEEKTLELERAVDKLQDKGGGFKGFVLPGTNVKSAHCDIARTVARRAERNINRLAEVCEVDNGALVYMNRLSDYLYSLARYYDGISI